MVSIYTGSPFIQTILVISQEKLLQKKKKQPQTKPNKPLDDKEPWFIQMPVGRNMLQSMVKEICTSAGIECKTNHSLRATSAARLFDANVPEKLIQERTGHRTLTSLRLYERTSMEQNLAVSKLLSTPGSGIHNKTSFEKMLQSVEKNKENESEIDSQCKTPKEEHYCSTSCHGHGRYISFSFE